MSKFDKQYYENLWGTVHRHDYCESLANDLIQRYGKCRILDIGTGCGYLVKVLREKGCTAIGIDVSFYALSNCHSYEGLCAVYGDIRSIPFPTNAFDVVHSQGVWEYIPKNAIQRAWLECKRVGKIQHHTIDYKGSVLGEEDFVTSETEQWWKDQFYPKILVACCTHECKSYAEERWSNNVSKFTYPNYDVLVVDNSPCPRDTKVNFPVLWKDSNQELAMLRVTRSMEVIRRHFLEGNYKYWFNLEIDVIPEPHDVIERMLELGDESDWISHAYPNRGSDGTDDQQGIGCSFLSRRMCESVDFNQPGDNMPDSWLWDRVRPTRKFKTMDLWGYFPVKHLDK